ncbi:hypothetical protein F8568_024050 [Actinomadura sp. LD22]|uniref:Uncharacterized protein n=1 Tax=Actinomadura physcomitrii TaxID=2650748 RepID=A0A6I4MHB2_9ACTN|nr:hypothetical protein [Actinomadura physcomitrii]MWA03397.1 hypothetical protein [Actinomadura physcomitrii]
MPPTSRSSPVRPAPAPAGEPTRAPDAEPAGEAFREPTDAAPIAASRTDPERFAALFRRHTPAIMRYTVREELIFDSATHRFLGMRDVVTRSSDQLGRRGSTLFSSALVRTAIVDDVPKPAPGAEVSDC